MNRRATRYTLLFAVLYGLLIVYASLFHHSGWHIAGNPFSWLTSPLPHYISRKDSLVNLLAYLPFGFLIASCLTSRAGRGAVWALSLLAGFCLSLAMESLQTFLPGRESSLVDLAANSSGTAFGAALALQLNTLTAPGGVLRRWRENWLNPGSNVGTAIFVIWALARLSPFIPARHWPGPLKTFCPVWLTLTGKLPFHPVDALVHFCYAVGLALLAAVVLRPDVKSMRLFAAVALVVLTARFFIVSGNLTIEEILGYLAGIGTAALLSRLSGDLPRYAAMAALVAGYVFYEVNPGEGSSPYGLINWLPFRYHMDNMLGAFGLILEAIWPFGALALLWMQLKKVTGTDGLVSGGVITVLTVIFLEWLQQYIPGRTADSTQALLALLGWSWPFYLKKESP